MKRSRSPRDLWASLLPIVGSAVALAAAFEIPRFTPGPLIPAWLQVTLILAGAILACHRPATGVTTLGLGVMILPLAFRLGGAARGALLAASALVISDLILRLIRRLAALQPPERRALFPRFLEDAGRAALATLAAGAVWAWLDGRWSPVAVLTAAAGAYFLVEIGL